LNKEEYLDAKSDDTLDVLFETEKRYSRSFPLWYAESHDGKKKEKTVGPKSPKKLCSPLCWKRRILSRAIRFLVAMKSSICNTSRQGVVHKFLKETYE